MTSPTTRTYSAEDDATLRELFGRVPAAQIGALIGRSEHSVRNRAQALGLLCGVDAERALADRATRQATVQLGLRIREVAQLRGVALPVVRVRMAA